MIFAATLATELTIAAGPDAEDEWAAADDILRALARVPATWPALRPRPA